MLSRRRSGGADRSIKSPWSVRAAGSRLPWGGECPRSASQHWAPRGRLQAEGVLGEGGKWVGQREEQLLQGELWMVLQKSPEWRHGAFASPPPPHSALSPTAHVDHDQAATLGKEGTFGNSQGRTQP